MSHWCWMCGRTRPNEKFSGKGHRNHLCKECARRPKAEREAIQQGRDIAGLLEQSRISAKNIERLEALRHADDPGIAEMAAVVQEVARVRPGRRKRLKHLARERPDLVEALQRVGLIHPDRDGAEAQDEPPAEWEPVEPEERWETDFPRMR